ncbi:DUF1800 domain-containing protein [Arcticibacterium luteifluviistationis]|uniref:DUF1800 domain-containing protein n=1 Tax=Arcticibacterium luteifluviistationis TaxID=1784714 RepID=A0A2Z4GDF8_9BACT|nr:DUF1800 family protein [Arcticibacterium luteifluviistationis]AWV99276.1 hypothetical protein DJ013_14320 [Arcticibacterium luteifluviistationis]
MKTLLPFLFCSFLFTTVFGQELETFGLGNVRNVTVTASSNPSKGINTLLVDGYLPNYNAASRFLSQATLGATFSDIEAVANQGTENWLENQLNQSNSFSIESYLRYLAQGVADSLNLANPPPETPFTVENLNLNDWYFDVAWFQGSMTAPDKVRWRVALALSEIFVTSRVSDFDGNPYALASYYDLLLDQSFGNYRALLDSITYHPTMAVYLTYMNNHAQGIVDGNLVFPDENYAREIMQLFSIGLYELNQDGTEKKDAQGNSIPTYDNNDIAGLAKVFTGLSWPDAEYIGDRENSEQDYTRRLKFFPIDSSDAIRRPWKSNPDITNAHQAGGKTFLGTTIGQGRTVEQGEADIQDALDVIFNHPNVGPFISRRLIQRLVTSNPSSAYIGRIAGVFNNNGQGIRGDLKAVVKAILLDREARLVNEQDEAFAGKLREPFVTYMNLVYGLGLNSSTGVYRNHMSEVYNQMEQRPLESPTVFNFFEPDYVPDGDLKEAGKFGPEFQKLNSITLTGYLNALNEWLIDDDPIDYSSYFGGETYKPEQEPRFDFSADYALSSDQNVSVLLDKYNLILAHGALSPQNLQEIEFVLKNLPYRYSDGLPYEDDQDFRIRMAIYLIMASPDFLINR